MTAQECLEEIQAMTNHGPLDFLACGCGDCLIYMYATKALEMLASQHAFGSDNVSAFHQTTPARVTYTLTRD